MRDEYACRHTGWLMGLLAWLVAASRETISQIVIIWIITASIGFANLPHCIVSNIEVATAWITGSVSFESYIQFLWSATVGNIIGGVLFVGILNQELRKFFQTMLTKLELVILVRC